VFSGAEVGLTVGAPPEDSASRLTVPEADAAQAPVVAVQPNDGRLDDGDANRLHTRELVSSKVVRAIAEQDDVV
jgi:hypothetical protein